MVVHDMATFIRFSNVLEESFDANGYLNSWGDYTKDIYAFLTQKSRSYWKTDGRVQTEPQFNLSDLLKT